MFWLQSTLGWYASYHCCPAGKLSSSSSVTFQLFSCGDPIPIAPCIGDFNASEKSEKSNVQIPLELVPNRKIRTNLTGAADEKGGRRTAVAWLPMSSFVTCNPQNIWWDQYGSIWANLGVGQHSTNPSGKCKFQHIYCKLFKRYLYHSLHIKTPSFKSYIFSRFSSVAFSFSLGVTDLGGDGTTGTASSR